MREKVDKTHKNRLIIGLACVSLIFEMGVDILRMKTNTKMAGKLFWDR